MHQRRKTRRHPTRPSRVAVPVGDDVRTETHVQSRGPTMPMFRSKGMFCIYTPLDRSLDGRSFVLALQFLKAMDSVSGRTHGQGVDGRK